MGPATLVEALEEEIAELKRELSDLHAKNDNLMENYMNCSRNYADLRNQLMTMFGPILKYLPK